MPLSLSLYSKECVCVFLFHLCARVCHSGCVSVRVCDPLLSRYREDFSPLVEGCGCYCCRNHQRAYLHHLLVTNELLAGVLLMLHNTAHYYAFFTALRGALASDKLDHLKKRVLEGPGKGMSGEGDG